jgi:hypothetical protein
VTTLSFLSLSLLSLPLSLFLSDSQRAKTASKMFSIKSKKEVSMKKMKSKAKKK